METLLTQQDVEFLQTLASMGIAEIQCRDLALRVKRTLDRQQEPVA